TVSNGRSTEGPLPVAGLADHPTIAALQKLESQTKLSDLVDNYEGSRLATYPNSAQGIRALMKTRGTQISEREDATRLLQDTKSSLSRAEGRAGWREKYLWPWLAGLLGGDKTLSRRIRDLKKQVGLTTQRQSVESGDLTRLDERVFESSARLLARNDPEFAKLRTQATLAVDYSKAAKTFASALRKGVREAREGANAKTVDLVTDVASVLTKNSGVGTLDRLNDYSSNHEVDEAEAAMRRVRNAYPAFADAAKAWGDVAKDAPILVGPGFTEFDFWADTLFDLDILGAAAAWSISSDLRRAANDMEEALPSVNAARDAIGPIAARLDAEMKTKVNAYRDRIERGEA
ncbi:MAG: hypothetical protein AAF658_17105, partial [Myxococcota bacterium]